MVKTSQVIPTFGRNANFIEIISKCQVRFLVVGGAAVAFYQCRKVGDVDDLDLLIDHSKENIERFLSAFSELFLVPNWKPEQLARHGVQIPIKNDYYIDILTPKSGVDFDELYYCAETAQIGHVNVKVISVKDLIDMKNEALKVLSQQSEKHRIDLRCLKDVSKD